MNTGAVGHCLDHSNQPFGLFTRNVHATLQGSEPRTNTGLAYPLEFEVTLI